MTETDLAQHLESVVQAHLDQAIVTFAERFAAALALRLRGSRSDLLTPSQVLELVRGSALEARPRRADQGVQTTIHRIRQ